MNNISKKVIINLLLKKEGDSFELGKYYFSSLRSEEKDEIKRLLNETSQYYFYKITENGIERSEQKAT